jgi:iron complex transport system ATP-binding protein
MNRETSLISGTPEDLVLSGMFEQVFQSQAFQFDKSSGSFKVVHPAKGQVSLAENGIHSTWTRRALEREGYEVINDPNFPIQVQYVNSQWQLTIHDQQWMCQDIAELLKTIREVSV